MRIRISLSLITPHLLIQISLRLKLLRKTNVMKVVKEAIQPLGSVLLRLPRKTKTKIKSKT